MTYSFKISILVLLCILLFLLGGYADEYVLGIGFTIFMYIALSQSWVVLSGLTGYISLGHVVFFGSGAYVFALMWGLVPIWFGVMVVIVLEMGLISPPVGVNVFVVKSVAPDVPMGTIFRGIWPFWLAMAATLAFLIKWPAIALYLPNAMFGAG